MTPTTALLALATAASLLLTGCAGTDPAASAAAASAPADDGASSSSSSSSSSVAPAGDGDLCDQLPLDQLNPVMEEFGEPLASTQPGSQPRSCLLVGTKPETQYEVALTTSTFDDVVAGREAVDTTAGARQAWLPDDGVLVQQRGDEVLTVTDRSTGEADAATAIVVANAVDHLLP